MGPKASIWVDFGCIVKVHIHQLSRPTKPHKLQQPPFYLSGPHVLTFTDHNLQNKSQPAEPPMLGWPCLRRMASSIYTENNPSARPETGEFINVENHKPITQSIDQSISQSIS